MQVIATNWLTCIIIIIIIIPNSRLKTIGGFKVHNSKRKQKKNIPNIKKQTNKTFLTKKNTEKKTKKKIQKDI